MEFHGRGRERDSLSRVEDPYFLAIWGRRRIGKTSLAIRSYSDHLYFFVGRKSPDLLLEEFTEVVKNRIEYIPTFKNWDEFFRYLFLRFDGTVIIDEFQNFNYSDPSVFTTLQKIIDDSRSYKLVIVGSYVGLMKRIFMDSKEPLFGRTTGNMGIGPLRFTTICEMLDEVGIKKIKDKIILFSIFGGVPYYYVLMEKWKVENVEDCIRKLVFSQLAPLRSEIRNILIEEFGRNYNTYFSIIQSIANGDKKISTISNKTGILVQSLGKYLQELRDVYDIIERLEPIDGGKRGVYRIKDPFTRFWFRYVESHQSEIESGRVDLPLSRAMDELSLTCSHEFESVIMDLIGGEYSKRGTWWNRIGEEIDVIGINEVEKEVLFCEVKWTNKEVGPKELELLKKRSCKVKIDESFRKRYLLVSRSGFKNLEENDELILWDLKRIEDLLK
jgi:hypothetical protein